MTSMKGARNGDLILMDGPKIDVMVEEEERMQKQEMVATTGGVEIEEVAAEAVMEEAVKTEVAVKIGLE